MTAALVDPNQSRTQGRTQSRTQGCTQSPSQGRPPRTTSAARRGVTIRPAPPLEPPFDDERAELATVTRLDRQLPFDIVRSRPAPVPALRPHRQGAPEPTAWARRLLIGMTEAAAGRRPLQQLTTFLSPSVHRGITTHFERAATAGAPHWLRTATVQSVHASAPAEDVVELCAVLNTGERVRAVALRIERWRGNWRCTRLQLG